MSAMRITILAAIAGAAAVGLAATASAELTDGTYQATYEHGSSTAWVVASCGAGCKTIQFTNSAGVAFNDRYTLNGSTWTTTPTGEFHRTSIIDNGTLAGTDTSDFAGEPVVLHFQLVKTG